MARLRGTAARAIERLSAVREGRGRRQMARLRGTAARAIERLSAVREGRGRRQMARLRGTAARAIERLSAVREGRGRRQMARLRGTAARAIERLSAVREGRGGDSGWVEQCCPSVPAWRKPWTQLLQGWWMRCISGPIISPLPLWERGRGRGVAVSRQAFFPSPQPLFHKERGAQSRSTRSPTNPQSRRSTQSTSSSSVSLTSSITA